MDLEELSIEAALASMRTGGTEETGGSRGTGELTAVGLAEAMLARAAEVEPIVHAYVHLDPDLVRVQARAADRRREEGVPPALNGIPIGVKDLFETVDQPTTAGSRVRWRAGERYDAEAVRRLRAAGAVIHGKHWTHEFGCGLATPPTRYPWDLNRYPGGSSVGGGVSVALGTSLAALGTDGAGSVRKPAALNGLVGLKPTRGAVPLVGVVPGTTSLDHVGWITRTVADSRLLFETLARPGGTPQPGTRRRIGVPLNLLTYVEAGVASAFEDGLEALASAGVTVEYLDLPALGEAQAAFGPIHAHETYRLHARLLETSGSAYEPRTRESFATGAGITAKELAEARAARDRLAASVRSVMLDHGLDALASPTIPVGPRPLDEGDLGAALSEYSSLTMPFNVTGQPAITVPCGRDDRGFPVGIQLAGDWGAESTLFELGTWVEAMCPRPTGAYARLVSEAGFRE
ncbi:amidase [Streptomyces sp. NPDC046821]|uniref:amidase n=1 Tax=Streptomyces sp. NPDC046821 TaxID=3154702 RepID=UPI0033C14287